MSEAGATGGDCGTGEAPAHEEQPPNLARGPPTMACVHRWTCHWGRCGRG